MSVYFEVMQYTFSNEMNVAHLFHKIALVSFVLKQLFREKNKKRSLQVWSYNIGLHYQGYCVTISLTEQITNSLFLNGR